MSTEISATYHDPQGTPAQASWDISRALVSFSLQSSMRAEASKATLVLIDDRSIFLPGGIIELTSGETIIFYGFITTITRSQEITVAVEAMDALWYLKNEIYHPWPKQTLSTRFLEICEFVSVDAGRTDETTHLLEPVLSEGRTLFSVISDAIDETLQNEKKLFYVRANKRMLELINVEQNATDFTIDSESFISGFQHKKSIADKTYNQIHYWRERGGSLRLVATAQDDEKTLAWGRLRQSRKIESNETDAQLRARAQNALSLYNVPSEELTITSHGDWAVSAGATIGVSLPELGEEYEFRKFIVTNCTHTYVHDQHTMNFAVMLGIK